MGEMKELYIEQYERLRDDAIEAGFSPNEADRRAALLAHDAMVDRLADMADRAKDAWKERGL